MSSSERDVPGLVSIFRDIQRGVGGIKVYQRIDELIEAERNPPGSQPYTSVDLTIEEKDEGPLVLADSDSDIDPIEQQRNRNIDPNEFTVQALRYMKGMLIIADNDTKLTNQDKLKFMRMFIHGRPYTEESLRNLEEAYAKFLEQKLAIDSEHAHKQVTMARGIGILLTKQPKEIKTVDGQVEEETTPLRVNEEFYQAHMFGDSKEAKGFLVSANKYAGFEEKQEDSWLTRLLQNKAIQQQIIKAGNSASPSDRWLPLSGNARQHRIKVGEESGGLLELKIILTGTVASFDLDRKLQEANAIAQVREIAQQIPEREAEFKSFYGDLANGAQFYFNDQRLLSPHYGEVYLYSKHKDNNAKFIEMGKQAMLVVSQEYPNVKFTQTNSAINKLAQYPSVKEFADDYPSRHLKLQTTSDMIYRIAAHKTTVEKDEKTLIELAKFVSGETSGKLEKDQLDAAVVVIRSLPEEKMSVNLKNEIIMRMRASYTLRLFLNGQDPEFNALKQYKKNLMIASLEALSQGKQALTVAGCKSARDRTAIFLCAMKTMMQDPEAMQDWGALNKGIKDSLVKGHHFRAMFYHCGMIKARDVHKDFDAALPEDVRKANKAREMATKYVSSPILSKKTKVRLMKIVGVLLFPASLTYYLFTKYDKHRIKKSKKSLELKLHRDTPQHSKHIQDTKQMIHSLTKKISHYLYGVPEKKHEIEIMRGIRKEMAKLKKDKNEQKLQDLQKSYDLAEEIFCRNVISYISIGAIDVNQVLHDIIENPHASHHDILSFLEKASTSASPADKL